MPSEPSRRSFSEMNASDARGFVPISGRSSHAPAPDLRAPERAVPQHGRCDLDARAPTWEAIVRPAPQRIMIYARYSLLERGLARAPCRPPLRTVAGGATFANLFPLVGAEGGTDVDRDGRGRRASPAQQRRSAAIVVKGREDRAVTSLDHFNAMTKDEELRPALEERLKAEPKRAAAHP